MAGDKGKIAGTSAGKGKAGAKNTKAAAAAGHKAVEHKAAGPDVAEHETAADREARLKKAVRKEQKRIDMLFRDEDKRLTIDVNRYNAIKGLISQAAFMGVMLDDLIAQMYIVGVTEEYKNGANQFGTKESTQSKSYNAMVKNYVTVIRTLADLTPEQQVKDELIEFIKRRRATE